MTTTQAARRKRESGDGWIALDLSRPMASAREAAGLTPPEARDALGLPATPGGLSTLHTPEQNEARGSLPRLANLLARCAAFGLDIEIRVRPRAPRERQGHAARSAGRRLADAPKRARRAR